MATVTDEDRDRARQLLGALQRGAQLVTPDGTRVEMPEAVVAALCDVLEATAAGDDAVVVRAPDEVSTEQAAAVLGVSRPTVVRMIDSGRLPGHMVGTHRRVQLRDLLALRDETAKRRRAALDRMTEEAEELVLYDS